MRNFTLIPLFGYIDLANQINAYLNYPVAELNVHTFPDGESLVTFNHDLKNQSLIFVTSLDHPNEKIIPLIFAAETARSLGAKQITLVATYLPYMRQDKVFHEGEGISARYFAKLMSCYFDRLITVDPHLHRIAALDELYTIPTTTLHATPVIATWIKTNINHPVLIGPDEESEQWVSVIAKKSQVPYLILTKQRVGDETVVISKPDIEDYQELTPVLIDDIISSGVTMLETVKRLQHLQMKAPVCIGVHALFAGNAYQVILNAGADRIVTCNSVNHVTNEIDLSSLIAKAILNN